MCSIAIAFALASRLAGFRIPKPNNDKPCKRARVVQPHYKAREQCLCGSLSAKLPHHAQHRGSTLYWPSSRIPDVSDTALQRDPGEFGMPRRLTAGAGTASFAMLNNFRCASQSAYFADACNVTAIPLNAEFKVFVRIKTRRIDGKFSHTSGYLFGRMKAA